MTLYLNMPPTGTCGVEHPALQVPGQVVQDVHAFRFFVDVARGHDHRLALCDAVACSSVSELQARRRNLPDGASVPIIMPTPTSRPIAKPASNITRIDFVTGATC